MRKGEKTVLQMAAALGLAAIATTAARAATYMYNFDSGQVTGGSGPGTALVGGTTAGSVGQDNWVLTSGASSMIRTDTINGFSGNYAVSPTVVSGSQDGILTRKNDANFGYSIGSATQLVLTMDVLTGPSGVGTQNRRSEMALGVDNNSDGKIRPTATTADNAEIAFMFGYEATGAGWYVRPAAFGTARTVGTTATGVWQVQLQVDLAANSGDGSGSLYIKQLFDDAGNAVTDTFHAADSTLLDFNLGIKRMQTVAGGSAYAANPANWDGLMIRTAGNGGLDNINITTVVPEPASLTLVGTALGLVCVRRRRTVV